MYVSHIYLCLMLWGEPTWHKWEVSRICIMTSVFSHKSLNICLKYEYIEWFVFFKFVVKSRQFTLFNRHLHLWHLSKQRKVLIQNQYTICFILIRIFCPDNNINILILMKHAGFDIGQLYLTLSDQIIYLRLI